MPAVHQAFVEAGKSPGLEIWRIENMEPVPVPKNQYGKFYSGDSYIVLRTTGNSYLSWDIHFWLGSKTSQDEAGAAAILSVNLDDNQFNGDAVQHRETQGYESKQFLGYFEPAIRYLDGGHASGFHHVTVNAGAEKRLYQIKGKRNVRLRQVEASVSAMNKGDCFILEVDHQVMLFVGEKATPVEKAKAITVAKQIEEEHGGRAHVEIIDVYASEGDVDKFFEALGSGDLDSVPDAEDGGDDAEFDRQASKEASLCEISDSSGKMETKKLSPPFVQSMLDTKECYILDTGSSIYVWVGKHSNGTEKAEAMKKAQQYLEANNYPSWVHISKVVEGIEPAPFKQRFQDWM